MNLKNILSCICILAFSLFVVVGHVSASEETDKNIVNGVIYGNILHEVMNKDDLNTRMAIYSTELIDGQFELTGNLLDTNTQISIQGDIYKSNVQALIDSNSNPFIIIPNEDKTNIEVLSLSFEENAYKPLLLPANYNLEGKTVIKLAIKVGGDIYYFEDEINNLVSFESFETFSESYIKDDITASLSTQESSNIERKLDDINKSANWFVPYLKLENNNVDFVENENGFQLSSEASCPNNPLRPVCGIPISDFRRPGPSFVTAYTDIGYYKYTAQFPLGSENYLTSLMKWTYIGAAPQNDFQPGDNAGTGSLALEVTDEGRYFYDNELRKVFYYSTGDSLIRLENPSIQVVLDRNHIIQFVQRGSQITNGPTEVNYLSLLGLLPYGELFMRIDTMFNAIEYRPETREGDFHIFHTTLEGNEFAYGNALRSFRQAVPNDHYLTVAGDRLGLLYTVQIPTDVDRSTGYKSVRFRYEFDVHHRDFYGNWNHIGHVDKNLIDSFRVY